MTKSCTILTLLLGTASAVFGLDPGTFSKCDVNLDGTTNVADVQSIINGALGKGLAANDLNGDGVVSVVDVQIVINAALNLGCTTPGSTTTGPAPTITDFNPKSAPAGTMVTITGTNLQTSAGGAQVTLSQQGGGTIAGPVSSAALTTLTFIIPAGAATGAVTVTANGSSASSSTPLTIVPASSFTVTAGPGSANLIQGQSISYSVNLASPGAFTQLAALSVSGVPSGATASFAPTQITLGQTSVLTVSAPVGQPMGASTLTVSAAATVTGIPVTSSANVTLNVTPVSTSFLGRTVVDNTTNTPLVGVTVSMVGSNGGGVATSCTGFSTTSDASGNFALTNLPAACLGPQLIAFNGNTVSSPAGTYAGLQLVFTLVANTVVVSPILVHLPQVNNVETFKVIQNDTVDQTYSFQSIPGLSVTVYAGTTFTDPDGTQPNPFPLAAIQVPVDRLPDIMPVTTAGVAPFIVAFQPAETNASQAVAVSFPNTLNAPPGTDMPLMTLDPTLGRMVPYGTGTVSNNGSTIIPDINPAASPHRYGIVHFDWHGPLGGPPDENDPPPDPDAPSDGEPVDLASGLEVINSTDITISGNRGTLALVRTYRTLAVQGNLPGPFGWGSFHNFEYRLDTLTPQSAGVINLILPTGTRIPFTLQADGTLINTTVPMTAGWVMTTASNGTTTLTQKGGTYYQFVPGIPPTGSVLVAIGDPNGNVTNIIRPPGAPYLISEIDDPVGRKLTFQYSGTTISQITDPIGRTVSYTYNSAGYLATFTDALGGVTSYQYDSQGRVTQITDPRGAVTTNTFDSNGRVISQTLPNGGKMAYAYTLVNALVPTSPVEQTVVTDPLGHITTYRFNTQGFVVGVTDPTGQVRSFTRQFGSNQILGLTGGGTCPACGYTIAGDITFTYDAFGNPLSQSDALGDTWMFTYDPIFSKVTSATDPVGNTTTLSYDARGNLMQTTDARGNTTKFTRNGTGLVTAMQDAAGNVTNMTYDSLGNLVSLTNPLGQKGQLSYDGASRLIASLDALGRTSTLAYNSADETTNQVDGNGHTIQFTYNAAGLLSSFADGNGGKTTLGYDTAGRLSSRTDALKRAMSYQYDADNNVVSFTNRRGQQATYSYDNLNRIVTETYVDATVHRTYDSYGRLTQVVDSQSGTFNLTYDIAGRLINTVGPNGTITYTRDANGRVSTRQVLGQPEVSYTYDANGNLTQATMGTASVTRTYDVRNRLISNARSNGVNGAYTFDPAGRLLSMSEKSGNNPLFSRTFTYDAVGQITGNTLDMGLALSTPAAAGTFDAANQIATYGSTTYTSDADGNRLTAVTGGATTAFTWDARGRLQSMVLPSGVATSFVYDPSGQMIQEKVTSSGQVTTLAFILDDASNIVSVQQGQAAAVSVLDGREMDDIIATVQGASSVFPLADQIASQATFTDGSGNVVGREYYEPYGESTASGTASLFQFAGRPSIGGGIYYDRARFYDSATGRFLSEDPAGLGGGSANFYQYAGSSPIMFGDPTGRCPWCIGAGIGFLGDLGWQLYRNGGNFSCINGWELAGATALGAGLGWALPEVWAAGLDGGANSVFWSGFNEGARDIAEGLGTTLEQTPIGGAMDFLQNTVGIPLPSALWNAASATFAENATGTATAVILNAGQTWTNVELPILLSRGIPIIYY
jgi:RHS repeat-associated protein